MPHQVEVGRCGSIGFRQRIGVQGAADPGARLLADALQQTRVRDAFHEYGAYVFATNLPDDAPDITRRRLGVGVDADGGNESDAVGAAEVAECVVRGDRAPLLRGDGVE